MQSYFKEGLHWLHLIFLMPITLVKKLTDVTNKDVFKILVITHSFGILIVFVVLVVTEVVSEVLGFQFLWIRALSSTFTRGFSLWPIIGLGYAMIFKIVVKQTRVMVLWLIIGLYFEVFGALTGGLDRGFFVEDLSGGLVLGLMGGMICGPLCGLLGGLSSRTIIGWLTGLGFCLLFGLGGGVFYSREFGTSIISSETLSIVAGYFLSFSFFFCRIFYLIPYIIQYRRGKTGFNSIAVFHKSPIYWDDVIGMPLPRLGDWLLRLTKQDREAGLNEILFVAANRPYQRRAAQEALLTLAIQDLEQLNSVEELATARDALIILPTDADFLPQGFRDAQRYANRISEIAREYKTRKAKVKVLEELQNEAENFLKTMALTKPPVGTEFQRVASGWSAIIKQTLEETKRQVSFTPIPNPFVVGSPLQTRDAELFKGRKDIIAIIEENIINAIQKPSLLLYGRRRTGKSSTLLNLPLLLSSKFIPIFIDCQNAKWRDGDSAFCYNLADTIFSELQRHNLPAKLPLEPKMDSFEKYPFTKLDAFLNEIEALSKKAEKQILLTFDEYERMELGIKESRITTEVFNQIRNIVQHRNQIVVLLSGSHHFEEMKTVNWSDYLINVKMIELSFLAPDDARELITEPVPMLQYESGVEDRIIELTHCQPYLLQALASDLVNYLNLHMKVVATKSDLDFAVEKVLVTADAYFQNAWQEDCSEVEQDVLRIIAKGTSNNSFDAKHRAALQQLSRKEIVKRNDDHYEFTIELFRRWVKKNVVGENAYKP